MEEMEGEGSISPSGGAGSRWNPTKEQINILETLYKQGIRTPSAEQIQHITGRLKAYGHIEGKNVFYWFQNHKARQRQKQKQESMVYLNQYLQKTIPPTLSTPVFNPSPGNSVVCSPYFIPPHSGVISYYPQYPKVPIPSMKRKQKGEKEKSKGVGVTNGAPAAAYQQEPYGIMHNGNSNEGILKTSNETLALFPVHPTGVLNESPTNSFISSSDDHSNSRDHSGGSDEGYGAQQQPYFDFFSHIGSRGSY